VDSIHDADPAEVSAADASCVGSWTKGLYVIRQGPMQATIDFIEKLGPLDGRQVAVSARRGRPAACVAGAEPQAQSVRD